MTIMLIVTRFMRPLAGGLVAGGLLLGACGSSDSPKDDTSGVEAAVSQVAAAGTDAGSSAPAAGQQSRGKVDPCALLTQEQVEVAGSEVMRTGEWTPEANTLGQQVCVWIAASEGSDRMLVVSALRSQDMDEKLRSSGYGAGKLFRDTRAADPQQEPVAGVGDEAFRRRNTLYTVKGDLYVSVQLGGGPRGGEKPPVATDTLKSLAQAALNRLGG